MTSGWSTLLMRRGLVFVLLIAVAAKTAATPRAFPKRAGGPDITFADDGVRATGATPGATIYFAGVSLYSADGMLHVTRNAGEVVAGADGSAEFLTDIHTRSVWLVVEPSKGFTVAAPKGMLLREMDLFPGSAPENGGGPIQRLLLNRFHVEAFLIRPGEGLWTAYFRDGGATDDDAEPDGRNHGNIRDLQPVGATNGSADHFVAGDYLLLVDRNSLEFHVARRGGQ
jgi:hypothetical protein